MNEDKYEKINGLIKMSDDCLKASRLLLENKLYPSSVNRSYYAMFDAARALLATIDIEFKTHKSIISSFSKEFVLNQKLNSKHSKRLVKAFENLMHSDYEYGHNANLDSANEILVNAEEFVAEIKSYLKQHNFID